MFGFGISPISTSPILMNAPAAEGISLPLKGWSVNNMRRKNSYEQGR
jgi:hypothetical protein